MSFSTSRMLQVGGGIYVPPATGRQFLDNFTDADTTLISAHTPDPGPGGAWTDDVGITQIVSNRILSKANLEQNILRDAGVVPTQLIAKFQQDQDGEDCALNIRQVDGTGPPLTGFRGLVRFNLTGNTILRIDQANGAGGWTIRATNGLNGAAEAGTELEFTLTDDGSVITLSYVNGSVNYSSADDHGNTWCGFMVSRTNDGYCDDFEIRND